MTTLNYSFVNLLAHSQISDVPNKYEFLHGCSVMTTQHMKEPIISQQLF